mgnify:CR=1 FL=1|jgi:hypothetical protein
MSSESSSFLPRSAYDAREAIMRGFVQTVLAAHRADESDESDASNSTHGGALAKNRLARSSQNSIAKGFDGVYIAKNAFSNG